MISRRRTDAIDDYFPREEDAPRQSMRCTDAEADFHRDLDAVEEFESDFDTTEEERGLW